jgi:hypothetical protein
LHKNPLRRVVPVCDIQGNNGKTSYDKEKYREMILDAAETVLKYFGFDRTVYEKEKSKAARKWWWLEELRQERENDIQGGDDGNWNGIVGYY